MAPPLVLTLRMRTLMITPVLLAVATAAVLFAHSDVNTPMLWSQCHARARLPRLGRAVPLVGTPLCYLVSFLQAALDSARARAVVAVVAAFVGALLALCALESARRCNRPARLVASPTPAWLLFNLLGGALVWQLLIAPAHFQRLRNIFAARSGEGRAGASPDGDGDGDGGRREAFVALDVDLDRTVPASEVVAIPVAVVAGYYLPTVLMIVYGSAPAVGVWLFFPVYVSLVRRAVRWAVERAAASGRVAAAAGLGSGSSVHLETHRRGLVAVYAVPLLASVAAHAVLVWSLTARRDDRREMTRSAIAFVEIDTAFVAATVLYWAFVETDWTVPALMVGISLVLGPGAGVLGGWLLRERVIRRELAAVVDRGDGEETAGEPSERTPLI